MRSKLLLVIVLSAAVFCFGCGGGGGGGGGGGTSNVTLTGTTTGLTGANSAWAASIRTDISAASLTAQAFDYTTDTTVGDAAKLDSAGGFTLSVPPGSNYAVKVYNSSTKFEFRKYVGTVSGNASVAVSDTSTAEFAAKKVGLESDATAIAQFLTRLKAVIQSAPTTITSDFMTYLTGLETGITNAKSQITDRNAAIGTYLKAKNLTGAVQYFSTNFGTTIATLTSTINLDNFKSVTQSRLDRYTINSYTFTIKSITLTATDTATVVVDGSIDVTDSTGLNITKPLNGWSVIWKYENGWLVYKDFPYLKEQISSSF